MAAWRLQAQNQILSINRGKADSCRYRMLQLKFSKTIKDLRSLSPGQALDEQYGTLFIFRVQPYFLWSIMEVRMWSISRYCQVTE